MQRSEALPASAERRGEPGSHFHPRFGTSAGEVSSAKIGDRVQGVTLFQNFDCPAFFLALKVWIENRHRFPYLFDDPSLCTLSNFSDTNLGLDMHGLEPWQRPVVGSEEVFAR